MPLQASALVEVRGEHIVGFRALFRRQEAATRVAGRYVDDTHGCGDGMAGVCMTWHDMIMIYYDHMYAPTYIYNYVYI